MIGSLHSCRNASDQGKGRRRTRVTIGVGALEVNLAALIARTLRDGYDMVSPLTTTSRACEERLATPSLQPSIGGA